MKKVTKHGWQYYQQQNVNMIKCCYCDCEFIYEKEDIEMIESLYDYFGNSICAEHIKCPECNSYVRIKY